MNIQEAIGILTDRITNTVTPDEAMKFSQAALNLTHCLEKMILLRSFESQKAQETEEPHA